MTINYCSVSLHYHSPFIMSTLQGQQPSFYLLWQDQQHAYYRLADGVEVDIPHERTGDFIRQQQATAGALSAAPLV